MNNRMVNELIEKANEWSYEEYNYKETGYTREQLYSQKLAKLIVLECANQCDLLLDHGISSEWSRGTHDCSRAIKKHFGVEP
jgi:hypothetical protein